MARAATPARRCMSPASDERRVVVLAGGEDVEAGLLGLDRRRDHRLEPLVLGPCPARGGVGRAFRSRGVPAGGHRIPDRRSGPTACTATGRSSAFPFHDLVPADPPPDGCRFVHGVQDPAVVRVVLGFVSGDVFVEQGAQSAHLIPLGNESIPCSARLRRRIESGPPKCKRGGSPSGR
jgi:hypothetical protein